MRTIRYIITLAVFLAAAATASAQQETSIYGDAAKADVRMRYVYTLEEAFKQAREQKKPIFFNCFADWAVPCHGMNKQVFSDQEFCDYMAEHFVCLFMDLSKTENESIAERYEVKSFAHFLVLDEDGNVLLRIVGGMPLPGFQEAVARSLSPKTSLAGTERLYKSGKYTRKDLANYLEALRLAKRTKEFREIGARYLSMLKPKEYARPENWEVFRSTVTSRDCEMYSYLIGHKADFTKANGEDKVNMLIESLFYWDILSYATGQKPYDAMQMATMYNGMQKASLPDTCQAYALYEAARLRGTKRYDDMLASLRQNGSRLGQSKYYIDMSLNIPGISETEREHIVSYLNDELKDLRGTQRRSLETYLHGMENKGGIVFEPLTLDKAVAKAKAEGKLVFIDCYTDWCVPCRKMANEVFTQPAVGGYFNKRFVCLKMDMENGEGPEVAKRYGVNAYPTLLVIGTDGKEMKRVLGARKAEELLQLIRVGE